MTCYDVDQNRASESVNPACGDLSRAANLIDSPISYIQAIRGSSGQLNLSKLRGAISKKWDTGADPAVSTPGGFTSKFFPYLFGIAGTPDYSSVNLSKLRGAISKKWDTGADPAVSTPGGFISEALPYLFGIAGLILFVMLVWGAIEVFFGAANPKSADQGKQRITTALIGFILLFAVFWLGQIIFSILGLDTSLFLAE